MLGCGPVAWSTSTSTTTVSWAAGTSRTGLQDVIRSWLDEHPASARLMDADHAEPLNVGNPVEHTVLELAEILRGERGKAGRGSMSAPRMRGMIDRHQMRVVHPGINLGRGKAGMAQQFLDGFVVLERFGQVPGRVH